MSDSKKQKLMEVSTKPASGFRDFLGLEAKKRSELIAKIEKTYESFGFERVETPSLENIEILLGSGGQDNEKLIFKILKRGEKLREVIEKANSWEAELADLGMRFDLTVPLCRLVAEYRDKIALPWKTFHIAPVWRAERAQRGRYREFFQCDVDIVGAAGIGAELEVIQTVVKAFTNLGVNDIELHLNHRGVIEAVAEKFGFGEKKQEFAILLDKRDKLSAEKFEGALSELSGTKAPTQLLEIIAGKSKASDFEKLAPEAYQQIFEIEEALSRLSLGLKDVKFNPSLVRGMGYYTGMVFEVMHASEGLALGGGGRYDKLVGRFSKQNIPAVGFSLGFERLLLLLEKSKDALSSPSPRRIFIPVFDEKLRVPVLQLATELRDHGMECDVYPDADKLKSQLKFASQRNYRWVLMAGEDEIQSREFKIKDFTSGEEEIVAQGHLPNHFKRLLKLD